MKGFLHWLAMLPRQAAMLLIRGYQRFTRPLFPPSCRFTPTCSSYALTSVERYGSSEVAGWLSSASAAAIPGTRVVMIPFRRDGYE